MFLGIDTSCYTTSLAIVDDDGNILEDRRTLLPVPSGKQGLQQSTALFYHLQTLPDLLEDVFSGNTGIKGREVQAVAASFKPRPAEDSYLPVFKAGAFLAAAISSLLGIPLVKTTHQEGHLASGLWSANYKGAGRFLVWHLSGGTTELLAVKQGQGRPLSYEVEIVGGSVDIPAGQLVDRVGTAMGLPFPCGFHLEAIAREYRSGNVEAAALHQEEKCLLPSSVMNFAISFSGAETKAKSYLKKGVPCGAVACAVEQCIAASLEKISRRAIFETGVKDVVLVGGVASNTYIRERLINRLEHRAVGAKLIFPEPRYCSDNAVGTSLIARSMIY